MVSSHAGSDAQVLVYHLLSLSALDGDTNSVWREV
jgi:hypothetical protein